MIESLTLIDRVKSDVIISPVSFIHGNQELSNADILRRYAVDKKLFQYNKQGLPDTEEPIPCDAEYTGPVDEIDSSVFTPHKISRKAGVSRRFFAEDESVEQLICRAVQPHLHRNDKELILSTSLDPINKHLMYNDEHLHQADKFQKNLIALLAEQTDDQPKVYRTNTFCAGFLTSIMKAARLSEDSGTGKGVIACAAEKLSTFFPQREYPSKDVTMFGDGAAAVKVRHSSEVAGDFKLYGLHMVLPDDENEIYISLDSNVDHKPLVCLPGGKNIIEKAGRSMTACLEQTCEEAGIQKKDLEFIGFHPGSTAVLNKFYKEAREQGFTKRAIDIERAKCRLDQYGNMGGATIGLSLKHALESNLRAPFGLTAVGAGYNVASLVFVPN